MGAALAHVAEVEPGPWMDEGSLAMSPFHLRSDPDCSDLDREAERLFLAHKKRWTGLYPPSACWQTLTAFELGIWRREALEARK